MFFSPLQKKKKKKQGEKGISYTNPLNQYGLHAMVMETQQPVSAMNRTKSVKHSMNRYINTETNDEKLRLCSIFRIHMHV